MLIKPAYSPAKLPQPDSWQSFVCGDYMREHTQWLMNDYGRRLRCGTTLGLGGLAAELSYQAFSLTAPVLVSPAAKANTIQAKLEHLPIKNAVVDQAVMPFVLEYSRDPHQVLREVNRVLMDDGYLFICGFNPLSPAMLSGWLPANRKRLPWSGRYFSAFRIKDWLQLLGYEIVQHDYYMGRFLAADCNRSESPPNPVWSEKLCQKIPLLHSGYAILARKCVILKTPRMRVPSGAALSQRPVATATTRSSLTTSKEVLHD